MVSVNIIQYFKIKFLKIFYSTRRRRVLPLVIEWIKFGIDLHPGLATVFVGDDAVTVGALRPAAYGLRCRSAVAASLGFVANGRVLDRDLFGFRHRACRTLCRKRGTGLPLGR